MLELKYQLSKILNKKQLFKKAIKIKSMNLAAKKIKNQRSRKIKNNLNHKSNNRIKKLINM